MKQAGFVLLVFILFGCSAQSHLVGRQWYEVETDHFKIITDSDVKQVAGLVQDLERFRVAIAHLSNSDLHASDKLTIFAAHNGATYRALIGTKLGQTTHGYFWSNFYNEYALVNMSGYQDYSRGKSFWARQFLFHEYTHYVMNVGAPIRYPYWYREGYAELMSTMTFEGGEIVFGQMPIDRAITLMADSPLPLATLLTAESGGLNRRDTGRLYATGWLLTHMLSTEREYDGKLLLFLREQLKSTDTLAVFESSFSLSVEAMESRLRDYMKRGITSYTIRADFEFPAVNPLVSPIAKSVAISQLGQLYALSGQGVEPILALKQQLEVGNIEHTDLDYSLVTAYLNEGQLEKADALMASLPIDGEKSFWSRFVRAEWLRRQAEEIPEKRQELLTQAYYLYKDLLEQDKDNAAVWYGLGVSASQLMVQPQVYARYMSEAYYLNPRSSLIMTAYFQSLVDSENWEELVGILRPLVEITTDFETRMKMRQFIQFAEVHLNQAK